MRARAQKKKKAPSEADQTRPPLPDAVEPPAEVAGRRVIPDPQGPPVVAPVLMPAAVLVDREDTPAAAAGAGEADRGAMAPVAETLMPVAAPPRLSITPHGYELPPDQPGGAQPTVSTPPLEDPAANAEAAGDAEWRARDEARLLVQSPRRLFLYWRFARDPRELLREALGSVAERFRPAVRLVDATTGEEGEPAPADGGDYWFDVQPGRLLRADVGFHGEGLPFVRLISSNAVETPAVGVSRDADEAPGFRVAAREFERVLAATGFAAEERPEEPARGGDDPARPFAPDQNDARTRRQGEPPRARASSDTARPASSPRDGGHFSNTRGGGELF